MGNSLPSGFLTGGTIVLRWEYESLKFSMMTFSPGDDQPHLAPDLPEIGSEGKVSANGKWLAFFDDDLNILLYDGTTTKVASTRKYNWGNIQGWLDTERIVFESLPNEPAALNIYNPFTNHEELFSPEIEDRYEYDWEWSGWPGWKLVVDPTLTRLAYMRAFYNGSERLHPPALVLINLDNGQTIWQIKRFSPGDRHVPIWSPDGSKMAVIADEFLDKNNRWEVFTVDRNGQAIQWIEIISKSVIRSTLEGEGPKWSPNGRYLALFGESLYVLDILERKIFDLCIPTGEWSGVLQNAILWSPDSTQVIFQRDNALTLVIDLESNISAPLVNDINIRPIAWMSVLP